jgi:hypothetical protein
MKQPEQRAVDGDGINGGLETVGGRVLAGNNMDGPWVVVQKQKKMRKGKERETPAEARTAPTKGGINGDPKLKGSRFAALSGDMNDLDEVVVTDMEGKVSESCQPGHEKNQEEIMGGNDGGNHDMSIPSGQRNNIKEVIEMSTNEKASKKGKLAARGSQNFKNKINNGSKKGGDNLNVMLREKKIIKLLEDQLQNTNGKSNEVDMWPISSNPKELLRESMEGTSENIRGMGQKENLDLGQMPILYPNIPRPPDLVNTHPTNSSLMLNQESDINGDNDEFVDANEHGSGGNSDSDMEIVGETPSQNQ